MLLFNGARHTTRALAIEVTLENVARVYRREKCRRLEP